jgi:hypothetical protein
MSGAVSRSIFRATLAAIASVVFSNAMGTADIVPLPPAHEEFLSPNKRYSFELSTPDNWQSRKSVGRLFELIGSERRNLWSRPLTHEYRPRYVLVGDGGDVLLVDEWANIKSRFAVMTLDRRNQVVALHDFEAVRKVLALPVPQVVRMARHGWWIVNGPTWETPGVTAVVEAAGKRLRIRITDGNLSLAP